MKKILTILLILGMILPIQSYAKGKNKTTKISKTTKSKKKKNLIQMMFILIVVKKLKLMDIITSEEVNLVIEIN